MKASQLNQKELRVLRDFRKVRREQQLRCKLYNAAKYAPNVAASAKNQYAK